MNEDEKKRLDEELAVANQSKGTSGGYTNSPAGLARMIGDVEESPNGQTTVTAPSFYSMFTQMTEPPVSKEEQERRARAATARQGIGALGNALAAFSNLTFTGKGAPSQTIPTQAIDTMGDKRTAWADKLKQEREKYAMLGLDMMSKDYETSYRAAKDKQAQDNVNREYARKVDEFERSFGYNKEKDRIATELKRQQQEDDKAYKEGMLGVYNTRNVINQQNADTRRANANTSSVNSAIREGKTKIGLVYGDDTKVILDTNKLDHSVYEQIGSILGEDILELYGIESYTDVSDQDELMKQAIGGELKVGNKALRDYLTKVGALTMETPFNYGDKEETQLPIFNYGGE